ncbi:hypothetical protein AMTRI_Chr08g206420 [Amborella trichopoda]
MWFRFWSLYRPCKCSLSLSLSLFLMKWCSLISFVVFLRESVWETKREREGLEWFAEGLDWVAAWVAEDLQGSEGLEWIVELWLRPREGGQGFGWLASWRWVSLSRGKTTGCKATSRATSQSVPLQAGLLSLPIYRERVLECGRIEKGVRS